MVTSQEHLWSNNLTRQTIPMQGSRVRLHGQGLGHDAQISVDSAPIPVGPEGKFAAEYLLPIGKHQFNVEFSGTSGRVDNRQVDIEVNGKYMFIAALADLNLGGGSLSGSVEPLAADDRYEEDFLAEGRLAFLPKGKIKGSYLITAQLDTGEAELGDLFSNLDEKDPRSLFRHLDPDRFYPVYGDDSTTYLDTNTQGRFYVRVDWDKSQALWGNFDTGINGNEFTQYTRGLYGAQIRRNSVNTTALGEHKQQITSLPRSHRPRLVTASSLERVAVSSTLRIETSYRVRTSPALKSGRKTPAAYCKTSRWSAAPITGLMKRRERCC